MTAVDDPSVFFFILAMNDYYSMNRTIDTQGLKWNRQILVEIVNSIPLHEEFPTATAHFNGSWKPASGFLLGRSFFRYNLQTVFLGFAWWWEPKLEPHKSQSLEFCAGKHVKMPQYIDFHSVKIIKTRLYKSSLHDVQVKLRTQRDVDSLRTMAMMLIPERLNPVRKRNAANMMKLVETALATLKMMVEM